jgi:hypothetical protein
MHPAVKRVLKLENRMFTQHEGRGESSAVGVGVDMMAVSSATVGRHTRRFHQEEGEINKVRPPRHKQQPTRTPTKKRSATTQ